MKKGKSERSAKFNEIYETILEHGTDDTFVINDDLTISFINPHAAERLGKKSEDLLGKPLKDFFPQDLYPRLEKRLKKVLKTGTPKTTEDELVFAGNTAWLNTTLLPLKDGGNTTAILGISRDVTERKQAEQAQADREGNFRALAENANDAIIVLTAGGEPLYANEQAAKMSGYEQGELMQRTIKDFVPKNQLPVLMQRLEKRIAGEDVPRNYESSLLHKDGHAFPVEITGSRTEWQGNPADLIIIRDITQRKQAEAKLKRELDFSNTVIQTSSTYFFAVDERGKILMMNDAFLSALGYSPLEVAGEDHRKFVPEHAKDRATQEFERTLSSAEPHVIEIETRKNNGESLLVQWHGRGIFDEDGRFEFAFAIGVDVTERRRQEQTIRELSEFRERLLRDAPVGIFTTDREGNLTSVNPRLIEVLGSPSEEETLKFNVLALEAIKKAGATEALHKVLIKQEPVSIKSIPYQSHWGKKATLSLQASPLGAKDGSIEGMLGIVEDISERRRLEEKLSRTQSKKIPLTKKEQEVLYHLTCDPHRNDREISEAIGIERSTITAIRNRLLSRGFYRKLNVPSMAQIGCSHLAVIRARYRTDRDYDARTRIVSAEKLDTTPEIVIAYLSDSEEFMVVACEDKRAFERVYDDIQGRFDAADCYDAPPCVIDFSPTAGIPPYAFDPARLLSGTLSLATAPHDATHPTGSRRLTRKEKLVYIAMVDYPMFNNTQLAEKIGVSRRKVSQTKQKLYDNGLLAPLVLPDLGLLGIEMLVFSQGHYIVVSQEAHRIREAFRDALPLIASFGTGKDDVDIMGFQNYTDYKNAFEAVVGKLKGEGLLHREPDTTVVPLDSMRYTKWDFAGIVKQQLSLRPF